jgi:hypothetical protein
VFSNRDLAIRLDSGEIESTRGLTSRVSATAVRVSTDDADSITANDLGDVEDMLSPMEATDSDDLHNDDGDEVVDPPDGWSGVDKTGMTDRQQREGETLDEALAEEEPDVTPADVDDDDASDTASDTVSYPGSDVGP